MSRKSCPFFNGKMTRILEYTVGLLFGMYVPIVRARK